MKSVLVACWKGGEPVMNLGEWFNEIILRRLGYGIRYWPRDCIEPDEPPLMMIGSEFHAKAVNKILKRSRAVHVWGQGNGRPEEKPVNPKDYDGRVIVHGLRGPITAEVSGVRGVPLCDPGWLLPPEWRPHSHGDRILYVPHWQQYRGGEQIHVLMPRDAVEPTMRRIVLADFVMTSTLHTMIACLAYSTPCALHSPGPLNMPQKWADVLGEVPRNCKTVEEGRQWWRDVGCRIRPPSDLDAFMDAFPHHLARET